MFADEVEPSKKRISCSREMSVFDRVESAKHTIAGSPIGKAVAKATSREVIGPKKKHVDCE